MKVIKTSYGIEIILPETENNSEFVYCLRQVRTLNNNDPDEQPLIDELEGREKPLTRRFLLLVWSMWNTLQSIPEENPGEYFDRWEEHNKTTFNEYYHDQMDNLIEEIDFISREYAERSNHGWSF